jgi:hypothetical protein
MGRVPPKELRIRVNFFAFHLTPTIKLIKMRVGNALF